MCLFTGDGVGIPCPKSLSWVGYLCYQVPSGVGMCRLGMFSGGYVRRGTPESGTSDTTGYGWQVGSTHPTGMLSWFKTLEGISPLYGPSGAPVLDFW